MILGRRRRRGVPGREVLRGVDVYTQNPVESDDQRDVYDGAGAGDDEPGDECGVELRCGGERADDAECERVDGVSPGRTDDADGVDDDVPVRAGRAAADAGESGGGERGRVFPGSVGTAAADAGVHVQCVEWRGDVRDPEAVGLVSGNAGGAGVEPVAGAGPAGERAGGGGEGRDRDVVGGVAAVGLPVWGDDRVGAEFADAGVWDV